VNRTLELLRAILRKCVNDWEWLDRAPEVRMLKEPTRAIRFLTRDEAHGSGRVAGALWRTWRRSRSRRDCGRPTSPVCSGRSGFGATLAWIHPDQAKARKAIRSAQRGSVA
jgi:hypothetical protein